MYKYTVVEIWTRLKEVEFQNEVEANSYEPNTKEVKKLLGMGYSLSNWHMSEHK